MNDEDTRDRIRRARGYLALSQPQLGEALGIAPNTLSRYEVGTLPVPGYLGLAMIGLALVREPGTEAAETVRGILGLAPAAAGTTP